MTGIVDKSRSHKSGQAVSRQKMIDRHRDRLKRQASDIVRGSGIDGLSGKKHIIINSDDVPNPPVYDSHGDDKFIIHGNKQFNKGDKIPMPPGKGSGRGQGSGSGEGDSESVLDMILTQEEFLSILFSGLELPNLEKTFFTLISTEFQRAGYTTSGSPTSLNLLKTMENAIARKVAAEQRGTKAPYIIEEDLRYNLRQPIEMAESRAVIFCIMDVSGSVTDKMRYASKIYFMLLHLFVSQMYKIVEVNFIQHASEAYEMDYDQFFNTTLSGGTMMAPAYHAIRRCIEAKYKEPSWNIYIAQTSDGEVIMDRDVEEAFKVLKLDLLPRIRHLSYLEFIRGYSPYSGGSTGQYSERLEKSSMGKSPKISVVTYSGDRIETLSDSQISTDILQIFTHTYKKRRES
jgi:uncharacterized sporulation protein YeaH/YhbH (DUF444 family)